ASIAASKNAVENNRLTTRRENKRIRKLAKGDKQEELRYLAAACALIKCSSELADNDPQKAALRELEKLGSSDELQAYRETLAAQEHTKNRTIFGIPYQKNEKLFQYTFFDGIFDGTKNIDNEYSITTRAGGVLQIGFAAIDGFGAAALSPGCSSVVGCIPSAYLTWSMADNGVTGAMTVYYGKTYHTQTAEGLAKILGVSVSEAELLFSLSTAGVTAKGFSDLAWKARATGQKLSAKEVEQISEGINRVKAGKETTGSTNAAQAGNAVTKPSANATGTVSVSVPVPVPTVEQLSQAAASANRNGLTDAGRALQKHGGREGSVYTYSSQKASVLNKEAQNIVNDILSNPKTVITRTTATENKQIIKVIHAIAPDGRTLRFNEDGTKLIGFREPKK
uniref:hypothetical protein n=1 Tax=Gilliamella sp. Nev6-6 TaxID=3120252 RepID=UPI000B2183C3